MFRTIALLFLSNVFMIYAWYGHLKTLAHKPVWIAILLSWGVALFEYCFQVPANRIGHEYFTLPQLKIIQEVITMVVFSLFAIFFMKEQLNRNYIYASLCMVAAVYFIFRK
ncbi:MAG TPA: DMT family protein [Bacteriovoracaceae bacterium]|nr:DMT family protein [Bacteriovoracaceae bacterium]